MARKEPGLPESVRVGVAVYEIAVMDPVRAERERIKSWQDTDARRIEIDMRKPLGVAAKTLLHEIIHAIRAEWDTRQDDGEERQVTDMENGLAAVLVDNPFVVDWIRDNL